MRKSLAIVVLFIAQNASAYILPPSYYFQQWTESAKTMNSFLVKQEREIISPPQVIQETVKIKKQGLYRFSSSATGQEEVKILGATKAARGRLGSLDIVSMQEVITPIETAILYSQSSRIESVLKQIGIDVTQYALELILKKKEIRVGDKKGNRIYIGPDSGKLEAMVYQSRLYIFHYEKSGAVQYFPSSVDIYEGNNELKEKVAVRSITPNAKFADLEFDVK